MSKAGLSWVGVKGEAEGEEVWAEVCRGGFSSDAENQDSLTPGAETEMGGSLRRECEEDDDGEICERRG